MGSPRAPPSPSSDESAKVAELLRRVGVLPPDLVVPGPHSQEACARRFLVARKWSVDEAEAQLRATLAWRRAHLGPMLAEAALPGRLSAVRRLVPSHPYLGLSKAGVPVSLACLCATEPAELAAKLTAADLTLDFVARAEWYAASVFAAASGAAGQVVDKEVSLVDLQGLYLAHRSVLHVFQACVAHRRAGARATARASGRASERGQEWAPAARARRSPARSFASPDRTARAPPPRPAPRQAFNAVASSNFPERTVHSTSPAGGGGGGGGRFQPDF